MKDFKTKYNYLIFLLRLLFLLFSLGLFIGFCFIMGPRLLQSDQPMFRKIIGIQLSLFVTIFLIYRFSKLLQTQRNILSFDNDYLILTDAIFGKQRIINISEIKGFSLTKYPTKIWDFKEILIYLQNGDKVELPQFLYSNFKTFKTAFEEHGLKFLGLEPFRWKFFDSRHYQYD